MSDTPITPERVEQLGAMFAEHRVALDEAMTAASGEEVPAGDEYIRACEYLELGLVDAEYSADGVCSLCGMTPADRAVHTHWHHRMQAASSVQSYGAMANMIGVDFVGAILRLWAEGQSSDA